VPNDLFAVPSAGRQSCSSTIRTMGKGGSVGSGRRRAKGPEVTFYGRNGPKRMR